ncbi:hypothetical protein ACH32_00045 [Staphylococcus aureus]|nr:hypothetical protein ACH32_00045 [Staphylococcus aureus]
MGCGPQHREIGFPISTDNASWRGPNIEAGGKSAYNNVQVGVDNEINFVKISFLSHSHLSDFLNLKIKKHLKRIRRLLHFFQITL